MKDDSLNGTYDLLTQDGACVPEFSDLGARIWIENGRIRYDASVFNFLGVGESRTDHFTYAIRMANGTLTSCCGLASSTKELPFSESIDTRR